MRGQTHYVFLLRKQYIKYPGIEPFSLTDSPVGLSDISNFGYRALQFDWQSSRAVR